MQRFDLAIVGAGAAGLFCAGIAGQRGLRVLLIDHAERVAEKIRISGGGRCNFTNRSVGPANFLSDNKPAFARTALAGYTPQDFVALLQRHRVPWHEKHKGQLFCDGSSQDVIDVLLRECDAGHVMRWQPCAVAAVRHGTSGFELDTARGPVRAARVVVATGGLSIPKIGATDFGHRLARQFGHRVIEPRPALVPLTFDAAQWAPLVPLAGVAQPVAIAAGSGKGRALFDEDLLFTHRGLSGPAVLQASSYWQAGTPVEIDLAPGHDVDTLLREAKAVSKRRLANELTRWLPTRLADAWCQPLGVVADKPLAEIKDKELTALAASINHWRVLPTGTEGWRKAEVTAGGVDTRELHPHSLESRRTAGLHFIGEVVDVTGWLGGYNFQWAWASAHACATACAAASSDVPVTP